MKKTEMTVYLNRNDYELAARTADALNLSRSEFAREAIRERIQRVMIETGAESVEEIEEAMIEEGIHPTELRDRMNRELAEAGADQEGGL